MQSLLEDNAPSASFAAMAASTKNDSQTLLNTYEQYIGQPLQRFLDKSAPHTKERWVGFLVLITFYIVRVIILQGFYIVSYGLAIFLLNLFLGFLSPLDESDLGERGGSILPMSNQEEFRPFFRRLPEMKFWYACVKAVSCAIVLTFLPFCDIPVFWPILVLYFFIVFFLTMRKQIQHMIKHKYIPFNIGKKSYNNNNSI